MTTAVHAELDAVGVRLACAVEGGGAAAGCPLVLRLSFPYGSSAFGGNGANWSAPDGYHTTFVTRNASGGAAFARVLDADAYAVEAGGTTARWRWRRSGRTRLSCGPRAAAGWARRRCAQLPVCAAAERGRWRRRQRRRRPSQRLRRVVPRRRLAAVAGGEARRHAGGAGAHAVPAAAAVLASSAAGWAGFWSSGAFLDVLSGGTRDPAAHELERRVVLSQYLLRASAAGAEPPAETGLLCNSWAGKHHAEMRMWNGAHWPVWGRPALLARSDGFFADGLSNASAWAAFQGYRGARWAKETAAARPAAAGGVSVPWLGLDHAPWPFGGSPNGSLLVWESAQVDNALILWQQPHAVWLSELQRRAANATGGPAAAAAVVDALGPLVYASADYLASRVYWNASDGGGSGRYWLGPPLMGGPEGGDPLRTFNPTFELVYTGVALDLAAEWREAAGLPPEPAYARRAGARGAAHRPRLAARRPAAVRAGPALRVRAAAGRRRERQLPARVGAARRALPPPHVNAPAAGGRARAAGRPALRRRRRLRQRDAGGGAGAVGARPRVVAHVGLGRRPAGAGDGPAAVGAGGGRGGAAGPAVPLFAHGADRLLPDVPARQRRAAAGGGRAGGGHGAAGRRRRRWRWRRGDVVPARVGRGGEGFDVRLP